MFLGFGLAGVVLAEEAAGLAEPGAPVIVVFGGTTVVVVGVAGGVPVVAGAAGKVVSGVGSGGNGFDNTLAINSFIPASD